VGTWRSGRSKQDACQQSGYGYLLIYGNGRTLDPQSSFPRSTCHPGPGAVTPNDVRESSLLEKSTPRRWLRAYSSTQDIGTNNRKQVFSACDRGIIRKSKEKKTQGLEEPTALRT
ncbi:unnamed protein product, partial [Ectocarpus sp. 4 AP-2014]